MLNIRAIFAIFVLFLAFTSAAWAADVTVIVPNVKSDEGLVRVFVCTSEEFLGQSCKYKKVVPAQPGKMVLTVKHVPPGLYAVQVYHDENSNGKVDFGFLGIFPSEGYGISRLQRLYSSPDFIDAAVAVVEPKNVVTVGLNYP